MIATIIDWQDVTAAGLVVLLVLIIVLAWIARDRRYSRVKAGFFVERQREQDIALLLKDTPEEFERWLIEYVAQNPSLFERRDDDDLPGDA